MSTRSRIGMIQKDGSVKSIYCHFDGYPEGVGAVLKKHYTNPEKVEELLELGDISVLGTFYDEELAKKKWGFYDMTPEEQEKFAPMVENMTVPYKDRGEDEVEAEIDENVWEFTSKIGKCGEDYTYLFDTDYSGVYRWRICETPYFKDY